MIPRADVGPKPTPTPRPSPAPGPTGPGRGHLPIGSELPDFADMLDAADRLCAQLIGLFARGFDPATGPTEDGAIVPGYVHARLMSAAADARCAASMLSQIRAEFPPPTMSGLQLRALPRRQDHRQAAQAVRPRLEGVQPDSAGGRESETRQGAEGRRGAPVGRPEEGPQVTTRTDAGECLSPGYAAADVASAARESEGAAVAPTQANTHPPSPAGAQRADMPSRTAGAPAAVVEAPGSTAVVPGAGVQIGLLLDAAGWPG